MSESRLGYADAWRSLLKPEASWVVFENGTCVVLGEPEADTVLADTAVDLMREWGPVVTGTEAADFNVVTLTEDAGWVVTCHHIDIMTLVQPREVEAHADDLMVGMYGRTKRDRDARDLVIAHVEDNRQ